MKQRHIVLLASVILCSCSGNTPAEEDKGTTSSVPETESSAAPQISYTLAAQWPHNTSSFTEGLLFHDGKLFESTGSPDNLPDTRSMVSIVDMKTGKIDTKVELDRRVYFGEGIVFFKDRLYQLTYKNQTCFVYDAKTFQRIKEYHYPNAEGWGLTADTAHIIMSDGTNVLTFLDAEFRVVKTLNVTENHYAVDYLNELEYINGFIYANIWMTNTIVKIDPATGQVVGKLDLTPLKNNQQSRTPYASETNGIAYDPAADKIYVTGKLWADMYEIVFKH